MLRITRGPALAQGLLIFGGCMIAAWNMAAGLTIGLLWLLPIVVAIDLGLKRGRTGWLWGFFLGWIGVLILALMRPLTAADVVRELEAQQRLEQLEAQQMLAEIDRRPRRA